MTAHRIFFFVVILFLFGVFLHSVNVSLALLFLGLFVAELILLILFWVFKKTIVIYFAVLMMSIAVGALYTTWHDAKFERATRLLFDEKIVVTGFVANDPIVKGDAAEFIFSLRDPWRGNVLVKTPLYPQFHYGDELSVTGIIKIPFPESYVRYLMKEGVSGVMSFPQTEIIGANGGSAIRRFLFSIKGTIVDSLRKILPPLEAAFLNGIMLGGQSEFPKEFKEAMRLSGTTHLVALSGYNITVIVWVIMGMLTFVMRRRMAFWITIIIIALFVLMTGAESSVVRAALMSAMILFAEQSGRIHNIRNIIILTAFVMVLENPNVLVFDVGFQLSFLAFFGILFLRPAVKQAFGVHDAGFLSWKENLITTFSAQVMVVPLLLVTFGSLSLTSLVANVIILEIIPLVMGLGFIAAAFSFFSYYGSLLFGLIALPLLKFGIWIIKLFALWSIPVSVPVSLVGVVFYYGVILLFLQWRRKYIQ